MASLQTTKATIETTQAWSSVVVNDTLTVEYVWVDIETKGIQYDLHLDLGTPIPESSLANAEFLALTWPMGGIWKIIRLSDNNQCVHCTSWRQTELSIEEVAELRERIAVSREKNSALEALNSDEFPLFNWKMQLEYPSWTFDSAVDGRIFTFSNADRGQLTSIDTVEQTFTADVTWEVTVLGVTTIREDSVLRELLNVLEFDEEEFEFTNISSTQEVRDVYYCMTPAGSVNFTDDTGYTVPVERTTESLNHVQISRRVVATFSEEMTVYSFPIDQQRLILLFHGHWSTFTISNYKLGNVFDVVYHDKIFIGEINAEGVKKSIRFEMMLERRPGYYTTNVAIPAAIITYLCFISYTTQADGTLVETGDRLQIVLTLLLTAVTFKNQVASLIPRISYFTMLDKYVFFCFIIACVVVLENALFPVVAKFFSEENKWQEKSLLWFSIGSFTVVNIVWGILIVLFVKSRKRASKVLLRVHEAIRVITASGIPAQHSEALLHEYLDSCNYQKWEIPKICTAEFGYLHVQLPEDEPQRTKNIEKRQKLHELTRHKMEGKLDMLKMMYAKLNPSGSPPKPQETFETGRAQPLRLSGHTAGARKRTRTQTPYHLMP